MCIVNKRPLDLNQISKIVLVTIYNEKMKINVFNVFDIFKEFGNILKIVIFKKKNFQILIEFENSENAKIFKKKCHN